MYKIWSYITQPIGNNEFSYSERIALWSIGENPASLGKIFVPNLVKWNINNLEQGSEIVFEEIVNNKVISCTGLKHFVETEYKWIPVYIVDNHNHVLTFRYNYYLNHWKEQNISIIHIDQHADTKPNDNKLPITNSQSQNLDLETFINEKTNVGNFISVALNSWIINEVIQIRTDYALKKLWDSSIELWANIVDIDIDFWVGKEITSEEIQIIRQLIQKTKIVTIATSPYFIEQKRAITIIKQLLS